MKTSTVILAVTGVLIFWLVFLAVIGRYAVR